MNQKELITQYLEDQDFLLEKWYVKNKLYELGYPINVQLTGSLPNPNDIQDLFVTWIKDRKELLKSILCDKFRYREYQNEVDIILEIATTILEYFDNSIEIATLIFKYGIKNLCN